MNVPFVSSKKFKHWRVISFDTSCALALVAVMIRVAFDAASEVAFILILFSLSFTSAVHPSGSVLVAIDLMFFAVYSNLKV